MRSLLLIVVTILLLAGGFTAYWFMQPPAAPQQRMAGRPMPTTFRSGEGKAIAGIAGPGQGVWVMQFDPRTGMAASRFRAEEYDPQKDGRVRVAHPQAEFFLGRQRNQLLRIKGQTGLVTIPDTGEKIKSDLSGGGPSQPPNRGELHDVVITYFTSLDAADANRPDLTVVMNNASFDNETFRIYTDSFTDASGKRIEGDQVPVVVRGTDYEFDGRGMTIRWNERDKRLQLLEIVHGQQLVIKHPDKLSLPGAKKTKSVKEADRSQPVQSTATAVASNATPMSTGQTYRASFYDAIRIAQSGSNLLVGDQMAIDFISPEQSVPDKSPASAPTTGKSAAVVRKTDQPAATEAAEGQAPIVIFWKGRLTVAPIDAEPIRPMTDSDVIIRMAGSPLTLTRQGNRIDCSTLIYQNSTAMALLEGNASSPVRMTDARGSVVTTESMKFSQAETLAILTGKSHAVIPVAGSAKQTAQTLTADWTRSCTLHFNSQGGDQLSIANAQLAGEVKVEHPQIQHFRADFLDLAFDSAAKTTTKKSRSADPLQSESSLRSLTASGAVSGTLVDGKNKLHNIECERLSLLTAVAEDGKIYPRQFNADGKVHLSDAEQDVRAGHIQASLVPPTEQAKNSASDKTELVGLRDLVAEEDVKITTREGSSIIADILRVEAKSGKPNWVKLQGKPATLASKEGRLTGPMIELSLAEDRAHVEGPGSLHAIQKSTPDAKTAQPMDVAWANSATIDGAKNVADVQGQVLVTATTDDGSINTAKSDHVVLKLASSPAPLRSSASSNQIDFLRDKVVQGVTLHAATVNEDVELQSVQPDPQGALRCQLNLLGPTMQFDIAEKGIKHLVIPASEKRAGRLLFVDRRAANAKAAGGGGAMDPAQSRGVTAFKWKKELTFDQAQRQIVMTGDVFIAHQPEDQQAMRFELTADKVVADFDSIPDGKSSQVDSRLQLKRVLAEGAVTFNRQDIRFTAESIEYDPQTHVMIARGTDRKPIYVERGYSTTTLKEIRLNTETEAIKVIDVGATGRMP